MLATCEKPIEGKLTRLVERLESKSHFSHSPCWSSDGSKVYYLSKGPVNDYSEYYQIWSVDLTDNALKKEFDNDYSIWLMDISHQSDLCVIVFLEEFGNLRLLDLVDSTEVESVFCPTQNPKFSIESDEILYYLDDGDIHKFNRVDSTDEVIWARGAGLIFAPGPGDTLFAVGDTVFNITTGEAIPIGLDEDEINSINWNPANAYELLISKDHSGDLLIFNLENRKMSVLDIKEVHTRRILDARFSPDGKEILFSCSIGEDLPDDEIWIFKSVEQEVTDE